jgi:hypothetical protein
MDKIQPDASVLDILDTMIKNFYILIYRPVYEDTDVMSMGKEQVLYSYKDDKGQLVSFVDGYFSPLLRDEAVRSKCIARLQSLSKRRMALLERLKTVADGHPGTEA